MSTTATQGRPRTATDVDLQREHGELNLPDPRPYGHFIPHLRGRDWSILSEADGCLGYFDEQEAAQPWLRMLVRDALNHKRRFDFALFFWGKDANGWTLAQRTVLMHQVPVEAAV